MPAKGKTQELVPFEPPKLTKAFLHSPKYKDRDYWGKHYFIKDCVEYWRAKEDSENAKRQETNWMKEMAEHHMNDAPGTGHAWSKQKKRDAAALEGDEDVQELTGTPAKQQQKKKKRPTKEWEGSDSGEKTEANQAPDEAQAAVTKPAVPALSNSVKQAAATASPTAYVKDVKTMFATAAAMESFHHTVKESANLMAVMEMQLRGSLAKNEAFEKEKEDWLAEQAKLQRQVEELQAEKAAAPVVTDELPVEAEAMWEVRDKGCKANWVTPLGGAKRLRLYFPKENAIIKVNPDEDEDEDEDD